MGGVTSIGDLPRRFSKPRDYFDENNRRRSNPLVFNVPLSSCCLCRQRPMGFNSSSGDVNTAGNWTPMTVPNVLADIRIAVQLEAGPLPVDR